MIPTMLDLDFHNYIASKPERDQTKEKTPAAPEASTSIGETETAAEVAQSDGWASAREKEIEALAAQTQAWAAAREQEIEAKAAQTQAWATAREQEIEAIATQTRAWVAAREKELEAKVEQTQAWAAAREQEIEAKIAQTKAWAAAREQEIEATVAQTKEWAAAREKELEAKAALTLAWARTREQEIETQREWAARREEALRRVSANVMPEPFDYTRRLAAANSQPCQGGGKIFGIGWQKTGTTSLEAFFKDLGFTCGDHTAGALLLRDLALRNFDPIIALARSAQFFQDIPFSLPFTFSVLDKEFPGAKFILSIRSDADEWYASLIRFVTKLVGKNRLPTADDLKNSPLLYNGFMFETACLITGLSEDELFDKAKAVAAYENHNAAVAEYFRHRPEALLTVNLADTDAAERIMTFVGMPYDGRSMPHLNKSG